MPFSKNYLHPSGYEGVGSDIKWCGRHQGGKRCLLCKHHAKFDEWSDQWHWYYLFEWYDNNYYWPYWSNRSYHAVHWRYRQKHPGKIRRYESTGLTKNTIESVLKRGCRKKRKCKCINIVQRGNWYCADCYPLMKSMASHTGQHIHDLMISDRDELKREVLIMSLSGAL